MPLLPIEANRGVTRRLPPRVERPQLRTTFQFSGELVVPAGERATDAMRRAIRVVVDWAREKFAQPLPDGASRGETFTTEMPGGSSKIECIGLSGLGLWSLRFVHPDLPFEDRPAAPGRMWTVEAALRADENALHLAAHITCASPPGTEEPIILTRPRFIVALGHAFELRDVWPLRRAAWLVDDKAKSRDLAYLLTDPDRQLPVHVITYMDPSKQYELQHPSALPLDGDKLANALYGLAHVVVLDRKATKMLSEQFGRDWGVFGGATRTFYPGLDLANSAHSDHPLVLVDRMVRRDLLPPGRFRPFATMLERRTREWNGTARFDWRGCAFFGQAQQKQMEIDRRGVLSEEAMRQLIEDQARTYEAQLSAKTEEADSSLDLAIAAEKERDYYRDQNRRLGYQLDMLRTALSKAGSSEKDDLVPEEPSFDDLVDWTAEHFVGRLELHPRAKRALKDARFKDPRLVFEVIQLLATHYRDSRLAVDGGQYEFEQGLARLGIEFGGSISEERAGAEGKTYYVRWPLHGVREEFLAFALKKGSNKDERHTLRIYFFWDEDSRQVVVGSLPGHLDNRMT